MSDPIGYFITWSCYGAHLHGSLTGTVDRHHRTVGAAGLAPNAGREIAATARMNAPPFTLDAPSRDIVLRAIAEVSAYRDARLWAAHVRTNHVHVVVSAMQRPERLMTDFKAYASRRLNSAGDRDVVRWARHGSTRYLWSPRDLEAAVHYVVSEQGAPLAVFDSRKPLPDGHGSEVSSTQ